MRVWKEELVETFEVRNCGKRYFDERKEGETKERGREMCVTE